MLSTVLDQFSSWEGAGRDFPTKDLRALAAGLGPGFRGERLELPIEGKQDLARRVLALLQERGEADIPGYLLEVAEGKDTPWRDRKAKLFEAGEYPEYGFQADAGTVQRLAENFEYPVPIFVEHRETPLRLGYLTQVEAVGGELFGMLALTPEAEDLLEKSGAKSLSLAISREGARIYEVSIVANPRVRSARLFCEDFRVVTSDGVWKGEAIRLREALERERLSGRIDRLVREGTLPPALREKAEALLWSARGRGLEEEVMDFLTSLPRSVVFQELSPGGRAGRDGLDGEVAEFYRTHFAGLPLEEILRRRDS